MNQNPYDSFKQGIKNDIKDTGASLFLIGGLLLLAGVLFSVLVWVAKNDRMDSSFRFFIGAVVTLLIGFMVFSRRIRTLVAQIWLVALVAIPILFVLFLIGYMFYGLFTQPLTN